MVPVHRRGRGWSWETRGSVLGVCVTFTMASGTMGLLKQSQRQGVNPYHPAGPLLQDVRIKSLEEIRHLSLPIQGSETIDSAIWVSFRDETLKVVPGQKQTQAGQLTRVKAFVTTRTKVTLVWVLSAPRR